MLLRLYGINKIERYNGRLLHEKLSSNQIGKISWTKNKSQAQYCEHNKTIDSLLNHNRWTKWPIRYILPMLLVRMPSRLRYKAMLDWNWLVFSTKTWLLKIWTHISLRIIYNNFHWTIAEHINGYRMSLNFPRQSIDLRGGCMYFIVVAEVTFFAMINDRTLIAWRKSTGGTQSNTHHTHIFCRALYNKWIGDLYSHLTKQEIFGWKRMHYCCYKLWLKTEAFCSHPNLRWLFFSKKFVIFKRISDTCDFIYGIKKKHSKKLQPKKLPYAFVNDI